jgi:BarA-like signal transduction histidine kinase
MPSLHLVRVGDKFKNYRSTLDKKRREVFDHLLYELAGRREETLVMHPDHTEAVMMNILVELEMQQQQTEQRLKQLEENCKPRS